MTPADGSAPGGRGGGGGASSGTVLRGARPADRPASPAAPAPRRLLPAPSRTRRAPTRGQMARRAFVLRWAKRILPALGVLLLAAIALWPELKGTEDRIRVDARQAGLRPDALRVVRPRYQGRDEQDRPFTVTAAQATQGAEEEILLLEAPRADILLNDGAWMLLEAREGRYDRARNHLDLEGRVTLYHDGGTMLETDRASIVLGEGSASGDAPVAAQGPFGTLTGEGFRLAERGAVVEVTGRSHAVLEGGEE
jgi:lipopolysaccharide export system protein LptC